MTGIRPASRFHAEFHHVPVLLVRKRRGFPRCAANHQPVRTGLDLPLHKGHERLLVDLSVPERRDEGGNGPFEDHVGLQEAGRIPEWGRIPR